MTSFTAGVARPDYDTSDYQATDPVQELILKELNKVNAQLDAAEGQLAMPSSSWDSSKHADSTLSSSTYVKTCSKTRCTQREQNARLHVTSLSSDIKYCKEDNKIKPNM